MRRIKLIIEYDGTNYCGWQAQNNGASIQEEIEKAISFVEGIERFEYKDSKEMEHDYIIISKNGYDIRKTLFKTLASADLSILMFKAYDVSLEDIFITLTEKAKEEARDENDE